MENERERSEWVKPESAPDQREGDGSALTFEPLAPTPLLPSHLSTVTTFCAHLLSRLISALQARLPLFLPLFGRVVASPPSRRWLARGVALVVTLGLIIVLFGAIILPGWRANFPSGAAHANGNSTTYASVNFAGNDWQLVTTSGSAQTVAFGVSSPTTVYSCGVPGLRSLRGAAHSGPVVVSVSHDGGLLWEQQPTHIIALLCNLSVDPTNPRDVILIATTCLDCFSPSEVFRSFDGAHTWRQMNPPVVRSLPGAGLALWGSVACCGVWVANTYYLISNFTGVPLPRIAKSVNGGVFHLLNANAVRAALAQQSPQATADLDPFWFLTQGSTLYMRSTVQSGCANGCLFQTRSTDGGNTWQPFAPNYAGQPVRLITTIPDGRTLIGQTASADDETPLLRSTDGGEHWRAYVPFPVGMGSAQVFATPNGMIYAWLEPTTLVQTNLPTGVYELAPSAASWYIVAPAPPGPLIAVSWTSSGHAQALWANLRTYGSQRLVGAEMYWL